MKAGGSEPAPAEDFKNGVGDDEPWIELVRPAGPSIWEVKTHPDLVVDLPKAPVVYLRDDEDAPQQSHVKGKRYRLKDLRKHGKTIYWTVEDL